MKLSQILGALPRLTQQELAAVGAAVQKLQGSAAPTIDDNERLLYESLTEAIGAGVPFAKFAASTAYKPWVQNASSFVEFAENTFQPRNRAARKALLAYLLGLIHADLMKRNVPISMMAVATNLSRIPELYDQAFPGYRASGISPFKFKESTYDKEG